MPNVSGGLANPLPDFGLALEESQGNGPLRAITCNALPELTAPSPTKMSSHRLKGAETPFTFSG